MKIYRDISEVKDAKKSVVTIGTFDGIHKGHQSIIDFVVNEAGKHSAESFVVTFEPHPRLIVSNNTDIKILTAFEEKAALFEKLNVQNLLVIEFNKDFSNTSYEDFVRNYLLNTLNAEHIVIGHDHHFGKGRGGNENSLLTLSNSLNFRLTVIPAVSIEGVQVSSSNIRNLLTDGELFLSNKLLGRNYSLKGIVVEGVQRGRELGFPTANIEPLSKHKLIPKAGVYAADCSIDGHIFNGVLNIGKRPTFENQDKIFIELHILDFNSDVYGKPVELGFIHRIRDEVKFNSMAELVDQIKNDIQTAKQIFKTK